MCKTPGGNEVDYYRIIYYARQPTPIFFTDENNLFSYRPGNQIQAIEENRNYKTEEELKQKPVGLSLQVIVLQLLTISKLHENEYKRNTNPMTQTTNIPVTNFIQPYLYQFFDDSHNLNGYGKPLKRPFYQYQSRLKAISIGQDIRQINW